MKLIEDLAVQAGAAIGSSRPVAETLKYVPINRYVGMSGQKFNGNLYIACGISGAGQHLKGIKDATTIVAINTNANAPIFKNADYGIVGDVEEILPLLTKALDNGEPKQPAPPMKKMKRAKPKKTVPGWKRYVCNGCGYEYDPHVQSLLKKAGTIDFKTICPLHGPVWRTDLGYFLDKYDKWSRYEPEEQGVMIVYASMYGNTEAAAQNLAAKLCEKGMTNVVMYDVSNTHVSQLISETFRLSHIVLASVTYNLGIYPLMHNYLMDMKALNLQKRTFAIIENGSWACKSGSLMREFIDGMREMEVLDEQVTLMSSMTEDNGSDMDTLADGLIESMKQ